MHAAVLLLTAGLAGAVLNLGNDAGADPAAAHRIYLQYAARDGTPQGTAAAPAATPPTPRIARPEGWPDTLQLGRSAGAGEAAAVAAQAPFGIRYQYLAGGVNTGTGWATWGAAGSFVSNYIDESREAGLISVFPYYMIAQSLPGKPGDEAGGVIRNLTTAATMRAYWEDLRLFFERAGGRPGDLIVLHVEPDLWGFAQHQSEDDDAATVRAVVGSSGMPELDGIPDTMRGFARAVTLLRDRYAPNVLLAYHLSSWGTGTDIALGDPGDAKIGELATRAAAFYRSLGADFDLVFNDLADRDAAFKEAIYKDGGASWWEPGDFRRHAVFLRQFASETGLPIVLWQLPLGNTRMRAMDNSWGHYQDNRVEWFLDDGSGTHLAEYRDAGVIALLFGGGAAGTTCACDATGDGVTNPAPSGPNTRPSLNADDDGGFFQERARAYYDAGPLPLAR
ncbi:MAG: hypothetical protein ACKVT1_09665 [Dehalococcoidia bacterium]